MLLNDKQQQWGLQWTLLLFSFLLPLFPRLAAGLGMVGLLICLVRPKVFKEIRRTELLDILAFSTPLLIWLPALISGNPVGAKVETKLGLFFIPLVMALVPAKDIHGLCRKMMKFFFVGLASAVIFCLCSALYTYLSTGSNTFFYSKLGGYLRFHPSYFSMYILLGISFFALFYQKGWLSKKEISFGLPVMALFVLFIVLLSSRSQWINFMLLAPVLLFPILKESMGKWKAVLSILSCAILCGLILYSVPATKKRLMAVVEKSDSSSEKARVSNVRFQTWDVAWELFKEEPITGVGVQNLQQRRQEAYQSAAYTKPFEEKYNAHNQYLDLLAASGFIPLFFWLICLLWQRPVNGFGVFYFVSLSIFLLSFLMESMLETARGVMVFSYVQGMFLLVIKKPEYEV